MEKCSRPLGFGFRARKRRGGLVDLEFVLSNDQLAEVSIKISKTISRKACRISSSARSTSSAAILPHFTHFTHCTRGGVCSSERYRNVVLRYVQDDNGTFRVASSRFTGAPLLESFGRKCMDSRIKNDDARR